MSERSGLGLVDLTLIRMVDVRGSGRPDRMYSECRCAPEFVEAKIPELRLLSR